MSSLAFLTSELQALSKEAGRRHADVKEAADKALSLLKTSPESALSDLHEADQLDATPPKYPVLLAPIVLGCATKNAKVISIAVGGLQRLTGVRGAITQTTVPLILSTLRSVLSQGVEIQLKTLQTLSSLLTNCRGIHAELLAETLLISFKLQESKIGVVSSTAAATLRQLVMFVFEAVDEEDRALARSKEDTSVEGPIPTDFTVNLPSVEGDLTEDGQAKDKHYLLPSAKDAYLLFEDICLLVNGESPSFLKLQSLPRTFGLELVESVLSDFSQVFRKHAELLHLLRTLLSPLLIRSLAEKPSFSTTLRLMRVMYLLLKKFSDDLVMEAEIFLSMFVKIVGPGETEGSGGHPLSSANLPSALREGKVAVAGSGTSGVGSSPPWMRVLALEILRGLCGDFELLSKIWTRYDASHEEPAVSPVAETRPSGRNGSKTSVFRSMITAFNRLATERPALLGTGNAVVSGVPTDPHAGDYSVSGVVDGIVGIAQQAASTVGVSGLTQGGLSLATASVKLQCIDQLDKADAPAIPDTYTFLLALQCLNAIADGFAGNALPAYQTLMNLRPRKGDEPLPAPLALDLDALPSEPAYDALRTTRAMADAGWPALLASLSFFLTTNLDDDLFTYTLTSFQNFTTTCGVLGLKTPRDAFLINLCKFAVPPSIVSNLASPDHPPTMNRQQSSIITAGTDVLGLTSQSPQVMGLSTRNLLCLRSLVGVSQALAGSLEKTWFYVFEALQNADFVVRSDSSKRQKKRSTISSAPPSHSSPSKSGTASATSGSSGTGNTASGTSALARFIPSDSDEQAAQQRNARLFEVSRALDDTAFKWFIGSLCRLNGEMIGITTNDHGELDTAADTSLVMSPTLEDGLTKQPKRSGINVMRTLRPGEKSYAITKLGEISVMNMHRLITRPSEIGWNIVVSHLLLIQHWQSAPGNVRIQAAEIFDKIISTAPKDVESQAEEAQKRVQEQVLQALAEQAEPQSGNQGLTDIEIRKAALDTLLRVLESHGHALYCGWTRIFEIIRLACPASSQAVMKPAEESTKPESTGSGKVPLLVRIAFPSLQLICSDFLSGLTTTELDLCITTLAEFGKQYQDINVALTAGGLLWQVSDHLQSKRRQGDNAAAYQTLWMTLLQRLLELCKDRRQEARDGAIQILWRSIELYGGSLDENSWEECLWKVIFPLLESLDQGLRMVEEDQNAAAELTAMGVPLLHKQWDDSKILALGSTGSVFHNELPTTMVHLPSFEKLSRTIITYLRDSFLTDRPAVATAAMKSFERICGASWSHDTKDKGSFVAETAWQAWAEIGDAIAQHAKQDLTQQSLESYVKIMTTLQRQDILPFEPERSKQLLGVLKSVTTYPFSPDYRPDQDALTPLQTAVLDVLDRVNLASHVVITAVLEDLSEYMTLAYTSALEFPLSPALSGPRKKNQKVTYVALSKTTTTRIVDIFHRFKDEPAIYATAVERMFAAYTIPLRLKYDCPAPSRFGEEQPLWKTATLHFLQLARTSVDSLDRLRGELDDDVIALIWRKMLEGFKAILSADCRTTMDMPPEDQRMEEDFDYAVIATLEMSILPKLGHASVPDDAIISLSRALWKASQLHTHGDESYNGLLSPTMTSIGSNDTSASLSRFGSSDSATVVEGTTLEDIDLPRERFAYWSLELLFSMCKAGKEGADFEQKRVAALTLPTLMIRCKSVLQSYLADSALRGRLPFSRVRDEELVYVLSEMANLRLDTGVLAAAYSADPTAALRVTDDTALAGLPSFEATLHAATKYSSVAHLFEVFHILLAILTLPALDAYQLKTVPYRSIYAADVRQGHLQLQDGQSGPSSPRELAQFCLEIIGKELGKNTVVVA